MANARQLHSSERRTFLLCSAMGCRQSSTVTRMGPDSEPSSPAALSCCATKFSLRKVVIKESVRGWTHEEKADDCPGETPGNETAQDESPLNDAVVTQSGSPQGRCQEHCVVQDPTACHERPVDGLIQGDPPTVIGTPSTNSTRGDPKEPAVCSLNVVAGESPASGAQLPASPVKQPRAKYGASIPIGGGKFVPVGTTAIPVANKMDFEAEKNKIEQEFTKLEEQLDAGTRDRNDIEREFDALTHKADTLRRLQDAEAAASQARLAPRATQLAPVAVAQRPAPRVPAIPSMAVVHWKKVTKEQFQNYRSIIIDKYGSGKDLVKSIERIPNRILITAPVPAVMQRILEDEELEPRPEPYQLPSAKQVPPVLAPLRTPH